MPDVPQPRNLARRFPRGRRLASALTACLLPALLAAPIACNNKPEPEGPRSQIITIFAPAEMEPFIRAAEGVARKRELGWALDIQTGGAQSLAWTIESGDTPDLYIASTQEMAEELIPRPTRITPWLHDQLVVVTLASNTDPALQSARSLERSSGKIAVGGEGTQLGEFARLAMRYAEIWPLVERRTTQFTNANHIFESIRNGETESGVVFASEAAAAGAEFNVPQVLDLPESVRIIYTRASFTDLGAEFADLLGNELSLQQAREAGFTPAADADSGAETESRSPTN